MDAETPNPFDLVPGSEAAPPLPPHRVDSEVVWRSIRDHPRLGPAVGYATGARVLRDDGGLSVVTTPLGSGRASRAGRRVGPRGRNIVHAEWDGRYDIARWEGATVIKAHRRGDRWSIWRWHDGKDWAGDWYGNLECPWRRSAVGYDTQDWVLDVVGEGMPGTGDWRVRLKDEDELDWHVETGSILPEQADHVRAAGEELIDVFEQGDSLLALDWDAWIPSVEARPVALPTGWQVV